jgi:hypothetical protein
LQGRKVEGVAKYEKAQALYQEATRVSATKDADCEAAIADLQAKLDQKQNSSANN